MTETPGLSPFFFGLVLPFNDYVCLPIMVAYMSFTSCTLCGQQVKNPHLHLLNKDNGVLWLEKPIFGCWSNNIEIREKSEMFWFWRHILLHTGWRVRVENVHYFIETLWISSRNKLMWIFLTCNNICTNTEILQCTFNLLFKAFWPRPDFYLLTPQVTSVKACSG